jgi:hypothetical protein
MAPPGDRGGRVSKLAPGAPQLQSKNQNVAYAT